MTTTPRKHSHYFKSVAHLKEIDVYRVLELFEVRDPCLQHAIKKLLVAGGRGAKDKERDVREAVDTLNRFLQMRAEDCNAASPESMPVRDEQGVISREQFSRAASTPERQRGLWYPDDSGKWVELGPTDGIRNDQVRQVGADTIAEVLRRDERDDRDYVRVTRRLKDWGITARNVDEAYSIVAYKVVQP